MRVCAHECVYICTCVRVCVFVSVHVCACTRTYAWMYICMCVHQHMCICVCDGTHVEGSSLLLPCGSGESNSGHQGRLKDFCSQLSPKPLLGVFTLERWMENTDLCRANHYALWLLHSALGILCSQRSGCHWLLLGGGVSKNLHSRSVMILLLSCRPAPK